MKRSAARTPRFGSDLRWVLAGPDGAESDTVVESYRQVDTLLTSVADKLAGS